MKHLSQNIILKSVAFLLAGIMIIMVANIVIFTHSHLLPGGQIISHAHPYDKTGDTKPFKSHNHSKEEILFFRNIQILFPIVFLVLLINLLRKENLFIFTVLKIYYVIILLPRDRSPPLY
jgi:hypothetical protein